MSEILLGRWVKRDPLYYIQIQSVDVGDMPLADDDFTTGTTVVNHRVPDLSPGGSSIVGVVQTTTGYALYVQTDVDGGDAGTKQFRIYVFGLTGYLTHLQSYNVSTNETFSDLFSSEDSVCPVLRNISSVDYVLSIEPRAYTEGFGGIGGAKYRRLVIRNAATFAQVDVITNTTLGLKNPKFLALKDDTFFLIYSNDLSGSPLLRAEVTATPTLGFGSPVTVGDFTGAAGEIYSINRDRIGLGAESFVDGVTIENLLGTGLIPFAGRDALFRVRDAEITDDIEVTLFPGALLRPLILGSNLYLFKTDTGALSMEQIDISGAPPETRFGRYLTYFINTSDLNMSAYWYDAVTSTYDLYYTFSSSDLTAYISSVNIGLGSFAPPVPAYINQDFFGLVGDGTIAIMENYASEGKLLVLDPANGVINSYSVVSTNMYPSDCAYFRGWIYWFEYPSNLSYYDIHKPIIFSLMKCKADGSDVTVVHSDTIMSDDVLIAPPGPPADEFAAANRSAKIILTSTRAYTSIPFSGVNGEQSYHQYLSMPLTGSDTQIIIDLAGLYKPLNFGIPFGADGSVGDGVSSVGPKHVSDPFIVASLSDPIWPTVTDSIDDVDVLSNDVLGYERGIARLLRGTIDSFGGVPEYDFSVEDVDLGSPTYVYFPPAEYLYVGSSGLIIFLDSEGSIITASFIGTDIEEYVAQDSFIPDSVVVSIESGTTILVTLLSTLEVIATIPTGVNPVVDVGPPVTVSYVSGIHYASGWLYWVEQYAAIPDNGGHVGYILKKVRLDGTGLTTVNSISGEKDWFPAYLRWTTTAVMIAATYDSGGSVGYSATIPLDGSAATEYGAFYTNNLGVELSSGTVGRALYDFGEGEGGSHYIATTQGPLITDDPTVPAWTGAGSGASFNRVLSVTRNSTDVVAFNGGLLVRSAIAGLGGDPTTVLSVTLGTSQAKVFIIAP